MKDSAPKWMGILAVAALIGVVAWVASFVIFNFAVLTGLVIGIVVGAIAAVVLWLGWREPAAGPEGPRDLGPTSTKAAPPQPTAPQPAPKAETVAPEATATAAAPATPEPAPAAAPVTAPEPAKEPAKALKPAAPKAKKPAAKAKPAAEPKPVAADGKPELLSAPRGGTGDDLKQIKGVGPKKEAMLNKMGVWHFDQVASWRKKEVEWVDENLEGFKGRVSRDEWVKQAKVLAKGGATEFSKKVKKGDVY